MFYFTVFLGNGQLNICWAHQYTCMIKEGRKTLLDNDKVDQRAEVSMQDLQGKRTTMYYKNNIIIITTTRQH